MNVSLRLLCANSLLYENGHREDVPACRLWLQGTLLDRVSSTCLANSELTARPDEVDVAEC